MKLCTKVPRDTAFGSLVHTICDLYTRKQTPKERIISFDAMTSLQPRTRTHETRPAQGDLIPIRLEHEYIRKGGIHLLAGIDIQTGHVFGITRSRRRQKEVIELFEKIERNTPHRVRTIHIICDNCKTHNGKEMQVWLKKHSRFRLHFTPVHCSWINQIEQFFSILKRKRLSAPNFLHLAHLEERIHAFIVEWNQMAHPFKWSKKSFEKILGKRDDALAKAA